MPGNLKTNLPPGWRPINLDLEEPPGMVGKSGANKVCWDALSCIHGCDPIKHPVVGIYVLDEGCVVHRTDRLQALCLQHFVSAKDGAIGGLVTVVDRLEEERNDT